MHAFKIIKNNIKLFMIYISIEKFIIVYKESRTKIFNKINNLIQVNLSIQQDEVVDSIDLKYN
jgi:hypothetical protein